MIIPRDKHIVLFDGFCNLCNSSINFVIDRDKKDIFRFVSLQSNTGLSLLKKYKIDPQTVDSIVLITDNSAFVKSTAALKIAVGLKGIWRIAALFLILPSGLRDLIYDWIARNRYKWFGKQSQCRIPTPELRAKFIE